MVSQINAFVKGSHSLPVNIASCLHWAEVGHGEYNSNCAPEGYTSYDSLDNDQWNVGDQIFIVLDGMYVEYVLAYDFI